MMLMGRPRTKDKHLPACVYHRSGAYFYVKGGKWTRLAKSLPDAMRAYGAIISQWYAPLMGDVFDRYELEILPQKAERTQKDYRGYLTFIRPAFDKAPTEAVRSVHIRRYMDALPSKTQANRHRSLLSDVFSWAVQWGVREDNPCREVKRYRETPRRRYVTDNEFVAVRERAPAMIQAAMDLALLTGLREGDLLRLNRTNLTDEGILVETGKTGAQLLIEWTDELRAAVELAQSIRPAFYIITTNRGTKYTGNGFKTAWRRLNAGWQFRDLRAKSASDHENGEHLGHQDTRMLNRVYRRKPRKVRPLES